MRNAGARFGERLLALTRHLCTTRTVQVVFEPMVADARHELECNAETPLRWWRTWLRAYMAVSTALLVQFPSELFNAAADRDRLRAHVAAFSPPALLATMIATGLFVCFQAGSLAASPGTLPFLIPSFVAASIPAGAFAGVMLASGRPDARVALMLGLLISTLQIAALGWVIPATNQEFRERAYFEQVGSAQPLARGPGELTLTELISNRALLPGLQLQLHLRASFAAAALALMVLALGLRERAGERRWILWWSVATVPVAYLMLYMRSGLPPINGAHHRAYGRAT